MRYRTLRMTSFGSSGASAAAWRSRLTCCPKPWGTGTIGRVATAAKAPGSGAYLLECTARIASAPPSQVDAQQSIRLDFAMFVLQFAHGHALTCPQTRAVMKASHAFLHRIQSEPNLDAIQVNDAQGRWLTPVAWPFTVSPSSWFDRLHFPSPQEDLKNMLMPMVKAAVSADEGFLLPEQLGAFGRFLVDLVVRAPGVHARQVDV